MKIDRQKLSKIILLWKWSNATGMVPFPQSLKRIRCDSYSFSDVLRCVDIKDFHNPTHLLYKDDATKNFKSIERNRIVIRKLTIQILLPSRMAKFEAKNVAKAFLEMTFLSLSQHELQLFMAIKGKSIIHFTGLIPLITECS